MTGGRENSLVSQSHCIIETGVQTVWGLSANIQQILFANELCIGNHPPIVNHSQNVVTHRQEQEAHFGYHQMDWEPFVIGHEGTCTPSINLVSNLVWFRSSFLRRTKSLTSNGLILAFSLSKRIVSLTLFSDRYWGVTNNAFRNG